MSIKNVDKIEKEYKTTVYTLIVLSGDLRNYLINKFDDCKKRITRLLETDKWESIHTDVFYKEWYEIENDLKILNIFSDKFYNTFYVFFYRLTNSLKD